MANLLQQRDQALANIFLPSTGWFLDSSGNPQTKATYQQPTMPASTQTIKPVTQTQQQAPVVNQPTARDVGATQPPAQPEIDYEALYSPLLSALAGQETTAKAELDSTTADLNSQKQQQLGEITDTAADQQKTLDSQRTEVDMTKQNAMKQARKLYNELQQNILARYGSGSSAGPAVSELLARSTNEQMGGAETNAARAFQDIADKSFEVDRFAKKEATRIEDSYESMKRQANIQYMQRLDAINAQKGNIEADKAAKRFQVLQERQAQIYALEQWKMQAALSLSTWTDSQKTQLSNSIAAFPKAFSSAWTTNTNGQISAAPANIARSVASDYTPAATQTLAGGIYKSPAQQNPLWGSTAALYGNNTTQELGGNYQTDGTFANIG